MVEIEIRPLAKEDDRASFCCGHPALDRFFRHYAGQNQFKLNVAVTYVAVVEDRIAGFATVAVGSLERKELPSPKLQRRLPAYPLPVLRLARLGVDESYKRQGIGMALLRHVLRLAVTQRDSVGCVGVVTDAKSGALSFYERLGFVPLGGILEGALHGEPIPMFLGMGALVETTSVLPF